MRISSYFSRIGMARPQDITPATLAALQFAQRAAIPFENLDVLLGRPVSVEPATIFTKLVSRARGGYCFEQNQLLAAVLADLAVPHRLVLARVWLGASAMPPLTHLAVVATLAGQDWLMDAGFGGGYCPPLPLRAGSTADAGAGEQYRLGHDADIGWTLDRSAGGVTMRQYSFTLADVFPADLRLSNHWAATHTESRFTRLLLVNRITADGRIGLTGGRLSRVTAGAGTETTITPGELGATLATEFGLALDPADIAALGRLL